METIAAALALGDLTTAEAQVREVASMPPGRLPPSTRASIQRFSAAIATARGEAAGVEANLKAAIGLYRETGLTFPTASAELELAEWLVTSNRAGEATDLLEDARTTFTTLGATPWLERVAAVPFMRRRERPRRPVLRRLRRRAGRGRRDPGIGGPARTRRGATPGLGPVRRPGGLHDRCRRTATPRRCGSSCPGYFEIARERHRTVRRARSRSSSVTP